MTKSSVAFVVLLVIALFAAFVSSQSFCGGAGYDVTSASQSDLVLTNVGGWNWTVHPCGSISAATNALCANETYGSMFCQTSGTTSWSAAAGYNTTNAVSARWLAITNGVQMSMETGEYCAAARAPREITIQFICNQTAIQPYLSAVTEPEVCWYNAVIQTRSACQATGATATPNIIGSSFWSTQCGGGVYDLTSLSTRDLYMDDGSFSYWVRPCALVSNSTCNGAGPTSFCQRYWPDANAPALDLSSWNGTVAQVWTVTDTGVSVNLHDGLSCGGQVRQATINFVCNPQATTARLSFVSEAQICEYVAVIQTALVCNGRNAPEDGFCGGAGYDMTALKGLDIQHIWNGYTWYFSPCDQVTVPTICTGKQSMLCQVSTGGQYNVASWNASIAASATWLAINNGVQYSVATGDSCGAAGLREVTVQFICNNTAFAWVQSITEPETCWYFVRIHSQYACDFQGTTAPHIPGSSYYDQVCGGSVYDFSEILSQGDLILDTNTSSTTQGYRYYLDLCGQVNFANCTGRSFGETMFCQVDKGNPANGVYSLANYNISNPAIYTVNTNGVTMAVEDGQPCGGIPERRASIQIICDGTSPARLESVREPETCHYAAVVRGRCNYMPNGPSFSSSTAAQQARPSSSSSSAGGVIPNPGRSSSSSSVVVTVVPSSSSSSAAVVPTAATAPTGGAVAPGTDSSSSSSLSGGAIAGIVIGVIAGVFILLAVIAVLCCGACGFGRSKKSSSDSSYGSGAGKFSEVDESSHVGENEVEMGETHS